jgi:chaperonin GroES
MSEIGILPAGHRLLVKPDEEVESLGSGLIQIPESIKERYHLVQTKGKLIAVGPTAWEAFGTTQWAKVGDTVMFAKYAGLVVKGLDGKQYRILNDEDLIAVVDPRIFEQEEKRHDAGS